MISRKNCWATRFQQYRQKYRKKYLRSSHLDGKREIACFHVETATGNWQKMAGKRGHVFILCRSRFTYK